MKPHNCQSINYRNNGNCTCYPPCIPPRSWTRCDGTCFQRIPHFYQQNPSNFYDQISHPQVQPWSPRSSPCNPSYFEKMNTKHKIHDPFSYRVTVREVTPSHMATAAAETYRTHTSKDSGRIGSELFDPTSASSHQIFQMTSTRDIYEKDDFNTNNQSIPSVPLKKCVNINRGIQVSSTSFIMTIDDQNSFTSDDVSEKSSESHLIHTRTFHDLSFPTMNREQPSPNHVVLSDDTINNQLEEHSSDNPLSSIDKPKRYEMHSNKEESSSIKFLHHDIPESTNDRSSIDNSYFPILPSPSAPNIDNIKSNEILVHSSLSNKSIPSLSNRRQKSSADVSKTSLPLVNTRSTLDFGLLIHETST